MTGDVDVLIYVKNLIEDLDKDNFFLPSQNPMMEKDIFEKYLLKAANENLEAYDDPAIDEEQLVEIIQSTSKEVLTLTINSLYDKGLIDMSGIDEVGDVYYKATDLGCKVSEEANKDIKKKNI